MATPFEVSLEGDIEHPEAGMTVEAANAWGFGDTEAETKEVPEVVRRATKAEDVEEPEEEAVVSLPVDGPNMTVNSPRRLWDAFGCIQLSFRVDPEEGTEGVKAQVGVVIDLWAELEEEYADEIAAVAEAANAITPAQVAFINRLCDEADEDVPEDIKDLGKDEASVLIQELKGKANEDEKPARRSSGRSSGRSSKRSSSRSSGRSSGRRSGGGRSSSSRGGRSRGGGKATKKQTDYLERLCDEADEDVPEDIDDLSGKEVSDLIQGYLND